MTIVVFTGLKRSGKDTCGNYLVRTHGFTRVAFADPIKEEYAKSLHISVEDLETDKERYRPGIIDLGMRKREEDENYWVKKAIPKIKEVCGDVCVTDCRFMCELQALQDEFGYDDVVCVWVDRDLERADEPTEQFQKEWSKYIVDSNCDIKQLEANIEALYQNIK